MIRAKRTEILIEGTRDIPACFAQEIESKYQVRLIEQPNNGTVMVKMKETAQRSQFYLGEVFVTECKVKINQAIGLGIVQGHEPELAYQLAVIDAAYQAGLEETKPWTDVLLAEERAIVQGRMMINAKVLETKVNFETMDDGM
ncbi:MAG: phosphonate C-P lyase system protein PhnG [Gorillibacterium sp.]|nr:phosphonate C-P lyase system protein PhnG [Gorillibacterium sp.]